RPRQNGQLRRDTYLLSSPDTKGGMDAKSDPIDVAGFHAVLGWREGRGDAVPLCCRFPGRRDRLVPGGVAGWPPRRGALHAPGELPEALQPYTGHVLYRKSADRALLRLR